MGFWVTNRSLKLGQTTSPRDSPQIVEFTVPADHMVKLKESEREISTESNSNEKPSANAGEQNSQESNILSSSSSFLFVSISWSVPIYTYIMREMGGSYKSTLRFYPYLYFEREK